MWFQMYVIPSRHNLTSQFWMFRKLTLEHERNELTYPPSFDNYLNESVLWYNVVRVRHIFSREFLTYEWYNATDDSPKHSTCQYLWNSILWFFYSALCSTYTQECSYDFNFHYGVIKNTSAHHFQFTVYCHSRMKIAYGVKRATKLTSHLCCFAK